MPNLNRACISFAILALSSAGLHGRQSPHEKRNLYWVELISPSEAVLVEYSQTSRRPVELEGVEVWPEVIGVSDPLKKMYWVEPNVTLELLREGYAQLVDSSTSALPFQEAQLDSKSDGRGLWAGPGAPPEGTAIDIVDFASNCLGAWGGIGTALGTVIACAGFLWRRFHRRPVSILFLGPHSVGKTWLWAKMRNPAIENEELESLTRTDVVMRSRAERPEPIGRYEITPKYVDTPGGQPGAQAIELMRRRWPFRPRSIWVILLSTTPLKTVTAASSDQEKIVAEYIAEQLGYLSLPLGILASKRAAKPAIVILVVSKFDLFSVDTPTAAQGVKERLRGVFAEHIARLEASCRYAGVAYQLEFCSALKGWRTDGIFHHIKNALFIG